MPPSPLSQELLACRREMRVWAVAIVVPETLAIVSTVFRLTYRQRTRGLWWDDYIAFISLVLILPMTSATWMLLLTSIWTYRLHITFAWLNRGTLNAILFSTRMSLALAIGRVMPPSHPVFRLSVVLSVAFGIAGLAFTIQYLVACAQTFEVWANEVPMLCMSPKVQAALTISSEIICDMILVLIPLRLFWHVRLQRVPRLLVLSGFSAGIVTLVVTAIAGVVILSPFGNTIRGVTTRSMILHIVAACALCACNALVVITYIYQLKRRHDPDLLSELSGVSTVPVTERQNTATPHIPHSLGRSKRQPSPACFTGTSVSQSLVLTEISLMDSTLSDNYPMQTFTKSRI